MPVFNPSEKLIAVLDIDSEKSANFDEIDQKYLEQIMAHVFGRCTIAQD